MVPYRIWIGIMIVWAALMGFIFLGHFQMSILAMMYKERTRNSTRNMASFDIGPRYNWTLKQEGQLISAFYYGLTIMSFPGGILADLVGPFKTILVTYSLMTIVTTIAVPVSGHNWIPLFVCRFITGLCAGPSTPCLMSLIAKWAPPKEKSIFMCCILGFTFGTLVTPPISSIIIIHLGWEWSFYLTSIVGVLFVVAWFILVSDYPIDNWFCSKEEATFINDSLEGTVVKGWMKPPIWQMLKSVPFIIVVLAHYGVVSGLFLVVVLLPKFLDDAMQFDLLKIGDITAIPGSGIVVAGIIYGSVVGYVTKKYDFDKKYLRKGLVIFSHLLPGIFLMSFLLTFLFEFGENLVIGLLVIATICTAAAMVTTTMNPQDLAPNFAGTQIGIMGLFGSTAGFIYPAILVELTKEKNDIRQWSILLSIIGVVYLFTGFLFIIFGTTDIQPWNEKRSTIQLTS
ncbi:sialin-like isoform X2 [Harmonia axyridis]|uniref:sialin-like isoform X2 n=1 Tax=Harmonia axyridis TaxID=115357 RepID=UPI001E2757F0|nr:sialin-like isoform X2 [Harmonia axyridis]